jgi:hypothetical protein
VISEIEERMNAGRLRGNAPTFFPAAERLRREIKYDGFRITTGKSERKRRG